MAHIRCSVDPAKPQLAEVASADGEAVLQLALVAVQSLPASDEAARPHHRRPLDGVLGSDTEKTMAVARGRGVLHYHTHTHTQLTKTTKLAGLVVWFWCESEKLEACQHFA